MTLKRLGRTLLVLLAVVVWTSVPLAPCWSQEPGALPAGWSELPPGELMDNIDELVEQGTLGDVKLAARAHIRSILLDTDLLETETDYTVLNRLHHFARLHQVDRYTPAVNAVGRARDKVTGRQDNWQGRPWAQLEAKIEIMHRAGLPFESKAHEAAAWLAAGGDVATIPPEDFFDARHLFSNFYRSEGPFSIRWEGQVTAPQTGNYTFSISPINVNSVHPQHYLQQTLTVSVGGQAVLSATPTNWAFQSTPVQLQQGEPAALQVDLTIDCPQRLPGVLHALLFWEGPGVSKSIVPSDRLTPPGGGGQGLQATYTWTVDGQPQVVTRTDPFIDFVWSTGKLAPNLDPAIEQKKADALWQQTMSPAFLDEWGQRPTRGAFIKAGEIHPLMIVDEINRVAPAESLTAARRQAFLEEMLARPWMYERATCYSLMEVYRSLRFGAAEKALDLFGQWAAVHADQVGHMPRDPADAGFDGGNRSAAQVMAFCVTHQLPQHAVRLQNEFLETQEGTCCLPVAYILAYSYLGQDRLDEWIDLLVAKLADESVTGDRRVNWLIARAHADGIRSGPAKPYARVSERFLAGRVWLDEASLIAESPEVRLRVAQEIAGRLACVRQFDAARQIFENAPDFNGRATDLRAMVDRYESTHAEQQQAHAAAAEAAYVEKLQERRDRAAAAGNTEAVNRYEALISEATSE